MSVKIASYEELESLLGKELGVSEYFEITQEQVNLFADATHDHQWIHTDPVRAAKESPFKGAIAHGYLSISMAPYLLSTIMQLDNLKLGVNYGIETMRFLDPVPVGARLRLRATLKELKNLRGMGKATLALTFETEKGSKPAATAEVIYLYQFA